MKTKKYIFFLYINCFLYKKTVCCMLMPCFGWRIIVWGCWGKKIQLGSSSLHRLRSYGLGRRLLDQLHRLPLQLQLKLGCLELLKPPTFTIRPIPLIRSQASFVRRPRTLPLHRLRSPLSSATCQTPAALQTRAQLQASRLRTETSQGAHVGTSLPCKPTIELKLWI